MRFLRNLLIVVLCVLLLPLYASGAEGERGIIRDLIAYYHHYGEDAEAEIENQLQTLSSLDPEAGETWRQVMETWAWINEDMPVHTEVLPDGLPTDDSLCIIVLGFGLKDNGDMKPELLDRLEVALNSAEKYPEAYILCTGGETANVPGVSEAGQMGTWLLSKGIPHNRLILEDDALSTTENARNSLRLLWQDYPQVKSIALVTSDYHIRWGMACLAAMNTLHGEESPLEIAGNAACVTGDPDRDTIYSQAWGISILGDISFDGAYVPPLYMTEQAQETQPEPMTAAEPVQEAVPEKPSVFPALSGFAAAAAVLFVIMKRKKSGSD